MVTALIFAGGAGQRMNSRTRPKQFLQLYGKEIIIHTLENFQNSPCVDDILVVCKEDYIQYLKKLLVKYQVDKVSCVVKGGKTGQESIYNGLVQMSKQGFKDDDIVLCCDGVRPFIDEELIQKCIQTTKEHGAAVAVTPCIETIVQLEEGKIQKITDRSKVFNAKAPQCFFAKQLFEAHEKARQEGKQNMIDSASLMFLYGHDIYTVQGDFDNIKITTPFDFYTFRALYDARENKQIFGI